MLNISQADQLGLLAHLAYDTPIQNRSQRADAFRQREQAWLSTQTEQAREIILALLDKYKLGGLQKNWVGYRK